MRLIILLGCVVGCSQPRGVVAPVASMSEPRASHSATLLGDGTILIAGGFRKGPDGYSQLYSDSTDVFDPASDRVKRGPKLREARSGHATAVLADGSVLVIGGWDAAGVMASCERYEPRTRSWEAAGALAEPRGAATATVLADGRIVVIGGSTEQRSLDSIEIYDPAARTWQRAGTLVTPRGGHTATLLADNTILVAGGAPSRDTVTETVERFDPATGHSVIAGTLLAPRYKHAATLLPSGDVLLIAGSDARDWRGKYATTERFDPRTGRAYPATALAKARFKLPRAIAVLGDGAIAVAGGASTIEVIRDGASREVADLGAASYFGTATLLASGELVVIGGYDERIRATSAVWRLRLGP